MKVLVLGVGNVLMTDDSVGVRVVNEIERRYRFGDDVEFLDGGTSGIELLSYISKRDHLIIIDALMCGKEPGTVVRLEGEDVPAKFMTKISPHQLGLSDVLAAATVSDELPLNMVLFGVEPKKISLGLELTDEVQASFEKLVNVVIDELKSLGYVPEPVSEEEMASMQKNFWERS